MRQGPSQVHIRVRDDRRASRTALAPALAWALISLWPAGEAAAQAPPPPANVVAAKAYATLERSCARCHQAGMLEGKRAGAGIANLLVLDEIARDPALVRPGVPDASKIYSIALTREGHLDILNDPAAAEPTALEVQALREWIGDLPPRALGACARRPRLGPDQVAARLATVLGALGADAARQTRFISLAGLHNDCATGAEIDALGQGLRALLADAAAPGSPARDPSWSLATDPDRQIFTVSLAALGWTAAAWDELVAAYPLREALQLPSAIRDVAGTRTPLLPADWLADQLLSRQAEPPSANVPAVWGPTEWGPAVWGLPAAQALQQAWRRPADFNRAAADAWLEPEELARRLERSPFDTTLAARQLRGGGVARRAALSPLLAAVAANATTIAPPAGDGENDPLEIALWTEADRYRSGDAAVFNVATSRDCHLTLINVDRAGRAIVLFPNEFEPDNLISAGRARKLPAFDAPYRFRFKEKGRETAVAICSLTHKAPTGILHDYDRLRFTSLGDWQLFLREPPDARAARRDDAATDTPRPEITQRRRGRRAPSPKATEPAPPPADLQTRTAITIDIE